MNIIKKLKNKIKTATSKKSCKHYNSKLVRCYHEVGLGAIATYKCTKCGKLSTLYLTGEEAKEWILVMSDFK